MRKRKNPPGETLWRLDPWARAEDKCGPISNIFACNKALKLWSFSKSLWLLVAYQVLAFGWFDLRFGKLSCGVWAQVGPVVVRDYKWELRLQHTRRCCLVVNMTHFQIPAWLVKIVYMGDACVSLSIYIYIYYSYCRYTWACWQCLECFKSEPSRAMTLPLILLFIFQTFIANIPQIFTTLKHMWNPQIPLMEHPLCWFLYGTTSWTKRNNELQGIRSWQSSLCQSFCHQSFELHWPRKTRRRCGNV